MTTRRLAAILAADVVGFSALMGQDEEGTLARIKSLRREVIEPKVQEHLGRIFKTTGDGFLVEFASPVEAVRCALELQEALASKASQESSRALQLRIGINLGDIIIEDDGDAYGDGVNVAARLEQLAEPGGVAISGKVYEEVRDKVPCSFEDRGEQQVRNIARPVRVYGVSGAPAGPRREDVARSARSVSDKPSIAVLPFANMGGDPEQVYFSDGITEDLITELARFRELLVIARNSSFAFHGKAIDVREVGRALNADYILEGSVRRAGNRVRITAQLVNASTGAHLWAERFDRPLEDVFEIQDDIVTGVVATVAQRIREDVEAAARRRPPQDVRAYDLFLQGNRLTDVFTPEAQQQAQALFERVREIDPTFGRAYTGLAYIYLNRAVDAGVGVPREKDPNRLEARRLAEQALLVDPSEPRVQATAGYIYLTWREFDRAERHLDLARAMNPNDATNLMFWGFAQGCFGRPGRGLPAAEMAYRLNPRHPPWYNYYLSRLLFHLRRYDEAAALLKQRTFDAPTWHPRDVALRAAACAYLGRLEEAQRCADWFLEGVSKVWRGDASAGPAEYVDWLVDVAYLQRAEDEAHLREGLRRAGLPA
ncbi:MAG TPA: adenylate/guanylate cyclase domain-containing protein [Microvirga sp.]|nr:adenylate/guanylate cyclase domain-containing protein [Microvirga sp.]